MYIKKKVLRVFGANGFLKYHIKTVQVYDILNYYNYSIKKKYYFAAVDIPKYFKMY